MPLTRLTRRCVPFASLVCIPLKVHPLYRVAPSCSMSRRFCTKAPRPCRNTLYACRPRPSFEPAADLLCLLFALQLLIDLHRSLLSLYIRLSRLSTSDPTASHEQIARCETLLNITSAEVVRVAVERTEDLAEAVRQWLDAQVSKHEQVRRVRLAACSLVEL